MVIIIKNISIWKNSVKKKKYPQLNEDKLVDVLIIGGGLTGVSSLYHLRNSNLNVMLVEQNEIGMGVTANSTGKLSYLQNDLIDKIRKTCNDFVASFYLKSQIDAIKRVVDTVDKEKIACDLEMVDSILYTNKEDEIAKIINLENFLIDNNISVTKDKSNLVKSEYMIKVGNTYIFHPLKFLYGLLKNNKYPVYENTSIIKIAKENGYYLCYTTNHVIKTKWVILASHYPYFIFPFLTPLKVSLEKSYLSAFNYNGDNISLISYSKPFISIRNYKDKLIYLSNSHDVNKSVCDRKNFEELTKKLQDLNLKPDYLWSNIDLITTDGLPYIGSIKKHMLIATGYNTWGLASSFLAGEILSDIINNKDNEYTKLFSPKRLNLSHILGGVSNTSKTIGGYINGFLNKDKGISYEWHDAKVVAINNNNNNNKVYTSCPHAHCKLIYNEVEETWDCPCHGSRFMKNGKCISGPANKDITYK